MANRRPLIINGSQLGNLEVGDVLVTPANVPYSTVTTFIGLSDVPSSYSGQAGKFLRVNLTATGLDFTTGGGGGGSLPLNEIGYGDGSSIISSPELTYNPLTGQLVLSPTTKQFPGNTSITGAGSVAFSTAGFMTLFFDIPATQGYLKFVLATPLVNGSEPTGLANDLTSYTATVTIDGTPFPMAIAGQDAQDFNSLAGQIGNFIFSLGFAYADIPPPFNYLFAGLGEFRIASNSTGVLSVVSFVDTGPNPLFGSLAASYNVTSSSSVPGADEIASFPPTYPTGLVGATTYSETITVDGVPHLVSFLGSAATTIAALTTQLSTQLATFATVAYDGINTITVTSLTTGPTSTVTTTQTDFLQTPGPVSGLASVGSTPGTTTQNDGADVTISGGAGPTAGKVKFLTNNRIVENNTEIYELSATTGATPTILLTADGHEIPLQRIPLSIGNAGAGVFEILAVGHNPGPPADNGTALAVRGGWDLGSTGLSSVKEQYVIGTSTIDVTLVGDIFRVTATGPAGIVWRARVVITQLPGDSSV